MDYRYNLKLSSGSFFIVKTNTKNTSFVFKDIDHSQKTLLQTKTYRTHNIKMSFTKELENHLKSMGWFPNRKFITYDEFMEKYNYPLDNTKKVYEIILKER